MFENQLCDNKIFHRRKKPFSNFFNYNVCSVLINLKKINKINKLKFFSINSFNLFSIKLEDYGNQKGNLYSFIKKEIRNKYKVTKNYNIYLITSPRFLGYVFNPISVYFVEFNNLIEYTVNFILKKILSRKKVQSENLSLFLTKIFFLIACIPHTQCHIDSHNRHHTLMQAIVYTNIISPRRLSHRATQQTQRILACLYPRAIAGDLNQ